MVSQLPSVTIVRLGADVVSSSPAARQYFFMYFPLTHSFSFFLYIWHGVFSPTSLEHQRGHKCSHLCQPFPSLCTALMRPNRPNQFCLQFWVYIYIYIYILEGLRLYIFSIHLDLSIYRRPCVSWRPNFLFYFILFFCHKLFLSIQCRKKTNNPSRLR